MHTDVLAILTVTSNVQTPPRLPDFYRHVLVFTPLAGSALGLFTVSSLVLIEWAESRHRKKVWAQRMVQVS